MQIGIIGLGLMGGSIALSLKAALKELSIIGWDKSEEHRDIAVQRGLVDSLALSAEYLVKQSDVVIVAVPVDISLKLIPQVMDMVDQQVVMDMGSTKAPLLDILDSHPKRKQFVATHPMAGTEFSGPNAAIENLFEDKTCIICDSEKSKDDAVSLVESLYHAIGMKIMHMEAKEHDMSAAYVSHISHISSFSLALTVLNKERNAEHLTNLASGGFASTSRLAKSRSEMWQPILIQNKEYLLEVMDEYIENMLLFKHAIKSENAEVINTLIKQANRVEDVLKKKHVKEPKK